MSNVAVIMPAAGASRRFHDKNYKKPFAPLAGRAVWLHTAEKFLNRADVKQVIVVIADEDMEEFQRKFGANLAILGVEVCRGGDERADSVEKALAKVKPDCDLVAVHDAARPCLADKWIDAVFEAAAKDGAAILAVPETATLKRVAQGKITETVSRESLWQAQTPQVFRREWLMEAYTARAGKAATDDAALVELAGHPVTIVEGSPLNLKITTRDDLKLAEQILKILPKPKLDGFANPFAGDDMWR
ncbi:2-C-methyl-D-erythritol 4-phosphate cytidylyltransferase [Bythopirellula goksoeyrii]|uniref:2-C-methyl-D-erythritol 4-phosphate cytidylyltransferase n=1 Tax=Bythopirellula goksoeyrii TaxID=1400387 RepID=A0A5B9QKY1_9BACT|nr:2-C-methyl-D-erythritol 4-phosphate cytidylyltransferase [Bythopirellula goksoeyrii]QEG34791.1 2-C-methyl-D-erythritol 4-phosphate cytidylyltransferase [Bythopirellula goksoeyrii]